jgi:hypothetical protein
MENVHISVERQRDFRTKIVMKVGYECWDWQPGPVGQPTRVKKNSSNNRPRRPRKGVDVSLSLTTALDGVRGQGQAPAPLHSVKRQYKLFYGAGWASGPPGTGAENLVPTGNLLPDRPSRTNKISFCGVSCSWDCIRVIITRKETVITGHKQIRRFYQTRAETHIMATSDVTKNK